VSEDLTISVVSSSDIDAVLRARLQVLFDANYASANFEYLEKSAATFGYVAIAEREREIVGFSFGDSVRSDLPGLDSTQSVALAGIACIDPSVRNRGLFFKLATEAMAAGGALDPAKPFLFAGRMAHAITYRAMAKAADTTVPAFGKPISDWHKRVGIRVAELLGSTVDPETFVVRGDGTPVGFPRVEYEATPEEQALFANVDRQHGDSLLSMCWLPSGPEGW
jgi:hypothetical protein